MAVVNSSSTSIEADVRAINADLAAGRQPTTHVLVASYDDLLLPADYQKYSSLGELLVGENVRRDTRRALIGHLYAQYHPSAPVVNTPGPPSKSDPPSKAELLFYQIWLLRGYSMGYYINYRHKGGYVDSIIDGNSPLETERFYSSYLPPLAHPSEWKEYWRVKLPVKNYEYQNQIVDSIGVFGLLPFVNTHIAEGIIRLSGAKTDRYYFSAMLCDATENAKELLDYSFSVDNPASVVEPVRVIRPVSTILESYLLQGLDIAIDGCSVENWKIWSQLVLDNWGRDGLAKEKEKFRKELERVGKNREWEFKAIRDDTRNNYVDEYKRFLEERVKQIKDFKAAVEKKPPV